MTPTTGAAELPEALRIAERCDSLASIEDAYSAEAYSQAAAELRRLHRENEALRAQPAVAAGWADALTTEDAQLLQKAVTDFEECGETDVPDEALRRFADMGYLECVHYHVMPAAQEAIDAALAAQRGGA